MLIPGSGTFFSDSGFANAVWEPGIDYPLSRRWTLRGEGDFVRDLLFTWPPLFDASLQNNFRFFTGVVQHF